MTQCIPAASLASRSSRRTLAGSRKPPRTLGKTGSIKARPRHEAAAQHSDGARRQQQRSFAGGCLGPLTQETFTFHPHQRAADVDRTSLQVDVGPHRGQRFANPDTRCQHEEHQVWQVSPDMPCHRRPATSRSSTRSSTSSARGRRRDRDSMRPTWRTGFDDTAPYRAARPITPETTERHVLAVAGPTSCMIAEMTRSTSGVVASLEDWPQRPLRSWAPVGVRRSDAVPHPPFPQDAARA